MDLRDPTANFYLVVGLVGDEAVVLRYYWSFDRVRNQLVENIQKNRKKL